MAFIYRTVDLQEMGRDTQQRSLGSGVKPAMPPGIRAYVVGTWTGRRPRGGVSARQQDNIH